MNVREKMIMQLFSELQSVLLEAKSISVTYHLLLLTAALAHLVASVGVQTYQSNLRPMATLIPTAAKHSQRTHD